MGTGMFDDAGRKRKQILRSAYPTFKNERGAPSCSTQDDTSLRMDDETSSRMDTVGMDTVACG